MSDHDADPDGEADPGGGVAFDPADLDGDLPGEWTVAELIAAAREAHAEAYVPYSEYPVGAVLLTADGEAFRGCNVENANYSNSLHAEEVAVGEAVKRGRDAFAAVAVASAARDGVTPCGMCRQTLAEFCPADLPVLCDEGETVAAYRLGDLLPETITHETLSAADED